MREWTWYTYNENDSLVSEYRPGDPRYTDYRYDAANHLIEMDFGDDSRVRYTRDFRGNKATETDEGGRVTTFEYVGDVRV